MSGAGEGSGRTEQEVPGLIPAAGSGFEGSIPRTPARVVQGGVARIAVLSAQLASQIAAGEVVERPGSAVKELVENSIDAGARRCDVEIVGGGVTLIRVRDDGMGMEEEDAQLALERHATSKLTRFEDLKEIGSFGFRGEALPSIASVSRFTLRTRAQGADSGVEVTVEGGAPAIVRPAGTAVGTEIEVRDLFYNVPARRKFLRSTGTESGHVGDALEGLALAQPGITFTLRRDGRLVREWLRAPDRAERVRSVVSEEDLILCEGTRGPVQVEAYLSRPDRARNGTGGLKLLVNGRLVRDRALAATVAQAYGSVLERGRYPRGVVYVDLPAVLVDVNVHPQKAEVRFADPRALTDAVYGILARELASALSVPVPSRGQWGARSPAATARAGATSSAPAAPSTPSARAVATPPSKASAWDAARPPAVVHPERDPWGLSGSDPVPVERAASPPSPVAESPAGREGPLLAVRDATAAPLRPHPQMRWSSLRFIAQVRQTYLLCEADDGLYVIDQHAASERVKFSTLRQAYLERNVTSQSLLFPLTVEVSPAEALLVEESNDEIAALGLEVRVRGPQALTVHAVPSLLESVSPERLLRDLLGEMGKTGGRGFSDAVDLALARMACHGAIRAGDVVSAQAAAALLKSLDGADFASFCPHGRPVVAFTSWTELERKVGRR